MIILRKDRKPKNVLAMLTLLIAGFAIDASTKGSNSEEARFLGIGDKKEVMPCVMGIQQTKHTFTIFWIKMGESWYTRDSC